MNRPIRVLVIGPRFSSPHSRGGMASIVSLMREHRDDRVAITTLTTFVDDPPLARLAVGVVGVLCAMGLLMARRVDVLHVHLAHRGSVVRKAAALLTARAVGVPAIIHAHSYDFAGWFDGLSERAQRYVRRALPADRWLVLGDGLAAEYAARLQLPPERLRVLRNPASATTPTATTPRATARPGAPVRAVFLGRLGQRKGSYDLIAAIALLDPATRAALRIVAAGDGEVDEVRAAARSAGVDDVLTVRSWLAEAERDQLLDESDVFVLPSYEEGLPMALLEAMARGLVPVTTPVGGIPELVTDGIDGLLVAPGDPAALARALHSVITDPARRQELGRAARLVAAEFDVDGWFAALIEEWTRLARPRSTRR